MFPLLRTIAGMVVSGFVGVLSALLSRFQGNHTVERQKIARRGFLRNAALGAALIVLAEIGAGFVRFFWPNKTGAFGGKIAVPASSVPAVNGTPFRDTEGKFYIVHTSDGILALYWKCVHLGCTVPWVPAENQFHCPCHGSIYNYEGVRTAGPAPRPLDIMAVSIDSSGQVIVDTGSITQRSKYEPSQATPFKA